MGSRRKLLEIQAGLFADMLRGHDMCEVRTDFPTDAKIIGAGWDQSRNSIIVAVESSEFDEVEDGYFAPQLDVTVTKRISEVEAILAMVRPDP